MSGLFILFCLPGVFAPGKFYQYAIKVGRRKRRDPKRRNIVQCHRPGFFALRGQGGAIHAQPLLLNYGLLKPEYGIQQGRAGGSKFISYLFQSLLRQLLLPAFLFCCGNNARYLSYFHPDVCEL